MFRRLGSRIAIASTVTLTVIGALAAVGPGRAQAASGVGPNQFFVGEVNGQDAQSVIKVNCPVSGLPAGSGHPVAGQTVEVFQLLPPVTSTTGFTGSLAVEIDAALIFPVTPVNSKIPVATFTQYGLILPIPTSITVPCNGTGVMSFSPYPLDSGKPSNVSVTFVSAGITPGGAPSSAFLARH